MKRKKWVELPSGRWVTSMETKRQGQLVCHVWPNGRYEITLGKEQVGRGCVFDANIWEAKRAALDEAQRIVQGSGLI